MKLIINIPEGLAKKHWYTDKEIWAVIKTVWNGTPIPDNATNGDVIKTLFPDLKITEMNDSVSVMGEHYEFNNFYPFDFWNAPYQKGGKE